MKKETRQKYLIKTQEDLNKADAFLIQPFW